MIIEKENEFDRINDLDFLVNIEKLFCIAIHFNNFIDKDN
jgi:hypothetical protein